MNAGEAFHVSCTITEQDHVSANFTDLRPRRWIGVVGILLAMLIVAVLALGFREMLGRGPGNVAFWGVLVGCIYFLVFFLFLVPRRARRLYRQTQGAGKPITFIIGAEGLGLRIEDGGGQIPWSHFHKWKQGRKNVLLYQNDALFMILPKRCFTAAQIQTLLQILGEQVKRAV